MDDYIKRSDAIKSRGTSCTRDCSDCDFARDGDSWCEGEVFVTSLLQIPAADVRPVKRGHWVKRMEEHTTPKYTSYTPIWSCSECGLEYDPALAPRIHFCYNCGADLRDKKE